MTIVSYSERCANFNIGWYGLLTFIFIIVVNHHMISLSFVVIIMMIIMMWGGGVAICVTTLSFGYIKLAVQGCGDNGLQRRCHRAGGLRGRGVPWT